MRPRPNMIAMIVLGPASVLFYPGAIGVAQEGRQAAASVARTIDPAGRGRISLTPTAPIPEGAQHLAQTHLSSTGEIPLILDDGTRDLSIGFEDAGQFLWLNRFTPLTGDFPLSLDEVQVFFGSGTGVNAGELMDICFYEDTDGDGDPGTGAVHKGTLHNAAIQALDDWSVYAIPPIAFFGPGDILIAVVNRTAGVDPGDLPAAIDLSTNQARSWIGTYFGNPPDPPPLPATGLWSRTSDIGLPGNWMVRGFALPGVVTPGIGFSPDSMMFMVSPGNVDSMVMTLTNSSADTIHFTLSDEDALLVGDTPWLNENPMTGSIPPGGDINAQIIVDATGLALGEYVANVLVTSDDQFHPDTTMLVRLEVGGAPDIDITPDSLVFPTPVLVDNSDTGMVVVRNLGNVDLHVSGVESSNPLFAPLQSVFSVAPLDSTSVAVVFSPVVSGISSGMLTFFSDDPDEPSVEAYVEGEAVDAAAIMLDPDSLSAVVENGDSVDVILTISNTGGSDLIWSAQVIPPLTRIENMHGRSSGAVYSSTEQTNDVATRWSKARVRLGPGIPSHVITGSSVLFDNGPFMNSPGTGVGGADESVLQNMSLGMTNLGFAHQRSSGSRVADDFTTTGNGWQIDQITFFAYQTFSDTLATIDHVNYRIWDGPPDDPASVILFGDESTNRLLSSEWSHVYRVTESTSGTDTDRPVMIDVADGGIFLPPGTYWLDWQTGGALASGPWAPPVTINGQTTTGNALQFVGSWIPAEDIGQQGFPFILEGSATGDFIQLLPPISGRISPGSDASMTVRLSGIYPDSTLIGAIRFTSNDSVNPTVVVPVSLTVGGTVVVGMENPLPSEFALLQNYPNPFNPVTDIGYRISDYGIVRLVVFDVLGREVATLVNERLAPGPYTIEWDAQGVPSGVYFYRLTTTGFVQTRKLILLR